MKHLLRYTILLATLIYAVGTTAAMPDVGTAERVFDTNVRTIQVAPADNPFLPPIIVLGGDNVLRVNFDYLDYDVHYLRYSVLHCDADWQPSQLVESEYVDGFNYADIETYAQSEATFAHYYNYEFTLPNNDMHLLKSGNYLLRVYEQDDPERLLFQTRFMLCEPLVTVQAQVSPSTDVDYKQSHQQLAIKLLYRQGIIADPRGELTTFVSQNTRTDNERTLDPPNTIGIGEVAYEHQAALIFDAGNEYRRFETVSQHGLNMGLSGALHFIDPYYHAVLRADEPRWQTQYLYDQTQFGRYVVRNADANNSNVESDYVVTHFTLDTGGPLDSGTLQIEGDLTRGLPRASRTMRYDAASGCYTAELLLKQGAYNYQYLWFPEGSTWGYTARVDGDKYQTINQYLVRVYYRPSGGRYDQLIGFGLVRSDR